MTYHTLQQIIDAAAGTNPWYDYFNSLARRAKAIDEAVANLEVGAAPGQFAPYDTRFFVTESGHASNAYTAALNPVATGQAMPTGYSFLFLPSTTNTGTTVTLDVGSTDGAVAVKKFDGASKADPAIGEIVAGKPVRLTFDGTHFVADIVPTPPAQISTLSAKTSNYTLQVSDLGEALTIVPIDISAGNVDIKELALASMTGLVRYVVSAWAGAGATYEARVIDASDAEVATLYAEGDYVDIAYDGATRTLGPERVTVEGYVPLTANNTVNNGSASEKKIWTSNLSVDKNIGGFGDFVTNFRIDITFDCVLHVRVKKVEDNAFSRHCWMMLRVNGNEIDDDSQYGGMNSGLEERTWNWTLDLSSGDYVEVWGRNHDSADDARIMGNVSKTQSKLWWWLERRRR